MNGETSRFVDRLYDTIAWVVQMHGKRPPEECRFRVDSPSCVGYSF
jgi:hypothetical protein